MNRQFPWETEMLSVTGEDALHFARLLMEQNRIDPASPHFRLEPSMPPVTNAGQLCHIVVQKNHQSRHPERPISALPNEVRTDADTKAVRFKQVYFSLLAPVA